MRIIARAGVMALALGGWAACTQVPTFAPSSSSITLTANSRIVVLGGTTELSALVVSESGAPVQDGTTVRFSTTLGSVSPAEVPTRSGFASATFSAGNSSGIAEVRATSGATGGASSRLTANVVQISIGNAAVNTITIRANPGTIGPGGGVVELVANVAGENGRALEGIVVTFNVDQGRLSAQSATTNASGEARTTLTTSQQTVATAAAGTKTSSNVTITVRSGPSITVACTPASGSGNCSAVQASSSNNTATVVMTVTRASGSSTLSSSSIDFGDGTPVQSLGNLPGGSATVTHSFSGPTSTASVQYTATAQAVDINGESTSAFTTVNVTPRTTATPIAVTMTATESTKTTTSARWSFTATATGGGEGGTGNAPIQSYTWDFGDDTDKVTTSGNQTSHIYTSIGRRTVMVTVRTPDGRTSTAREEIIVAFSAS